MEVDAAADLTDPSLQLDERLVVDKMNSCIRDEIDSLPGDYRAAIILHDLEGQTAAEGTEVMGGSLATAKIRIHRARARLKNILRRDCDIYRDEDHVFRCDRKTTDQED